MPDREPRPTPTTTSTPPTALAGPSEVAALVRAGSLRALGRAVSWLEADDPRASRVLAELRRSTGTRVDAARSDGSRLIGLTGSPGSGKSSLADRMVEAYRAQGLRVAVIAVDPTSPYSGGAILGDRIRMTRWHADAGVFVRSMATRGQLGGLAAATLRIAALLDAAGYDRVLIETVGVGQSEVDVAAVADTTVLVMTPAGGDGVQAFKAGVMEIADLFVINKADLPGADRLRRDVRAAQGLSEPEPDGWTAPVVQTRASDGTGVPELLRTLDEHADWLAARGGDARRRHGRVRAELEAAMRRQAAMALRAGVEARLPDIAAGRATAEEVAADLLRAWSAPADTTSGTADDAAAGTPGDTVRSES